jgi:TP901 family phage tail tape measure protein
MASDVDIILDIAVNGVQDVYKLSNAMQQLNRTVQGVANPIKNLDARSRALSKAVGASDSSLKNHARTISQLATNNAVLTNELKRVQKEITGLGTSFKFATGASAQFRRAAVSDLKAYESALKGVRLRALVEDLRTVSQEQKRLGKDAQFVGRSLIIGLTTPIMAFGRAGLQSLVAIDREFVRLNKVLESVAPNLDAAAKKMGIDLANATERQSAQLNKMVDNYNELDKALTKTSTKFGLSKSLAVGLAGEFAELGIQSTENIALITELTAVTEKLGGMDIGNAKELVQSLYFQAQRAMQQSGQANRLTFEEREIAAIKAATTQLNMFNAVENVTALTLKDLGDAFPEVAAAGSSFGLSMTELAAMLAPMKAAGFEVGASANSIKVSLQRLTAPTKQNAELFKRLSKEYNTNFNEVKGIGLDAIQQLIDGFNELRDSAAGQEGAMEFFAKVFGVRQGPRMEVAIAQMAAFDKVLKSADTGANTAEKRLQGFANTAIEGLNKTQNAGLPVIKSFSDIGIIARIATARVEAGQTTMVDGFGRVTQAQVKAAREVRKSVADEVFKAQQAEGEDLIGQVATEAGRAMFIQLAGASNAAGVAQRELENALQSLDVKLAILKNNFKMFAAELLKGIRPALEKISEVTTQLYEAWQRLTPEMKKRISTIVLSIAGLTAAIGPLIFVFGQFRLAMGSVAGVLFKFLPSLKTMSIDALAARSKMLNLTKPIFAMGETVVNTNGKFATMLATIASGGGPIGKFAEKIGIVTGKLQKQTTAQIALTTAVNARRAETGFGLDDAIGAGEILRTGKTPKGFKALSAATLGPSAMPAMPVIRKLTAAELALPDADRIAHEKDVAKKAADAYTQKYRETLRKLLAGKPMPLAGGIGPSGMYRYPAGTVDDTGKKIGGRILNFGKIKAQAEASAAATSARIESIENARGLRELKKYNAERVAQLRENLTEENKIALERYQQLIFRRDAQVQAILAEQNALRDARLASMKAQQEAKGITTKLGGVGTGTLVKERFFKGRRIDDNQFDAIMGGGVKGSLVKSRLAVTAGVARTKELVPKVSGKFLGGKQTIAAATGIATFGKDLFTQPKKAVGDFFGLFPKAFKGLFGLFGKIGPMFGTFVKFIKSPTLMFGALKGAIMGVVTAVKAFVVGFGMVTGIGLIIAGVVAIVVILVRNWDEFLEKIQPGIKIFKETFGILKDAVMGLVAPIMEFFNALSGDGGEGNAVVGAMATAFNVVAHVVKFLAVILKFLLVEVLGRLLRSALSWLLAALRGIGNFLSGLFKVIKGIFTFNWGAIVEGFKKIGKGIAQIAIGLMGPFSSVFTFILKGIKAVVDGLAKLPFVGGMFKSASKGIESTIKFIEDTKSMKSAPKEKKVKVEDPEAELDVNTDLAQEQIANATGEGMADGAEEGAKAMAKKLAQQLKEIKNELQQEIVDRIKDRINSVVDTIKDGLTQQKEASLAVYDAQIQKIDDVAKAEDRLTKEQEYQNKLREAEEQRVLNRANNRRNYLMAIYAGQIDEARNIADEGSRQESEDTKNIEDIQTDRSAEVAEQNRKDMIESIKDAKKVAQEYFDEMIKNFTDAAKKITEFPPTTAEEFNAQLTELGAIATTAANNIGTNFSESFNGVLASLGVDAAGPLTSSLAAISQTLIDNNPFGEDGIWNKTIDDSINALTRKYQGLTNTLSIIIDDKSEAFKKLFETYKKYKAMVDDSTGDGTGTGGSGGTGGGSGGGTGGRSVTDGTQVAGYSREKIDAYIKTYMDQTFGGDSASRRIPASIKSLVTDVVNSSLILGDFGQGQRDLNQAILRNQYPSAVRSSSRSIYDHIMRNRSSFKSRELGGVIPYGQGGPTMGPVQQSIPAILHGGEYVVRNSAVKKYGSGMMEQINQGTFKPKEYFLGGIVDKAKKVSGKIAGAAKWYGKKVATAIPKMPITKLVVGGLKTMAFGSRAAISAFEESAQFAREKFPGGKGIARYTPYDYIPNDPKTGKPMAKVGDPAITNINKGTTSAGSWSDFKKNVGSIRKFEDYGFGDIKELQTGNKWFDRGIGLTGDMFLDPSNLIGAGLFSKFAKAGKLGKLKNVKKILPKSKAPRLADNVVPSIDNLAPERIMLPDGGLYSPSTGRYTPPPRPPSSPPVIPNIPESLIDQIPRPVMDDFVDVPEQLRNPDLPQTSLRTILQIPQMVKEAVKTRLMTPKKAFMKYDNRSPQRYDEIFGAPGYDIYPNRMAKFLGKKYNPLSKGKIPKMEMPSMKIPGMKMPSILSKQFQKFPLLKKDFSFASFAEPRKLTYQEEYLLAYSRAQSGFLRQAFEGLGEGRLKSAVANLPRGAQERALGMSRRNLQRILDNKFAIRSYETELGPGNSHWDIDMFRISKDRDYADVLQKDTGKYHEAIRKVGSFQFSTERGSEILQIKGLYADEAARTDIVKVLAFVYNEIMKPRGIRQVLNSSYSKYSYTMSRKFSDLMQFIDPDVVVHTPGMDKWAETKNNISFGNSMTYAPFTVPGTLDDFVSGSAIPMTDSVKLNIGIMVEKMLKAQKIAKEQGFVFKSAQQLEAEANVINMKSTIVRLTGIQEEMTRAMYGAFLNNPTRFWDASSGSPSLFGFSTFQEIFDAYYPMLHGLDRVSHSQALDAYYRTNFDPQAYLNSLPNMIPLDIVAGRFYGGGVPGFESQGVPTMLHGGEYVVNAKAVKNIGFAALEAMNNMRYSTPKSPNYSGTVNQPTSSNSNVHIYVDNFIGERAWFESMMKDYNVKVAPQNQKSAGLNNTTISTYSGINRGL